ncbi:flagellar biosynthetic protein FliR [Paracoccus caeni]|uniref:Flagellar biosynthetic protein FliR n=1 Tax=Paracoccus caeni TaxID=657651 RepID=A0A934SA57_9RHOB|nr:flagellar biosynthetic protein FliR [Paracoccus caeni]MBK4215001.1 flagellar biosynthetic protein FliR [Paracoccus caeni]
MMWQDLTGIIPDLHWGLVLVYLRVQACILALPGLGERVIPVRVRAAVGLSITPLLAGLVPMVAPPQGILPMIGQGLAEIAIGAATGGLLRLLAMAIDVATSAIAATASLSQIVGGQNEAAPHPIGNLIHLGGIAVLMALGLPVMLVELMADSFVLWPAGSWPEAAAFLPAAVQILSHSFVLAMLLAAPFTLGGFVFQALSGVINRVMPALPVTFIGSPLAILMALVALAILAPMLVGLWADAVLDFTLPRTG